jgi:hypothetical protein
MGVFFFIIRKGGRGDFKDTLNRPTKKYSGIREIIKGGPKVRRGRQKETKNTTEGRKKEIFQRTDSGIRGF